jgi:hypothetical protein
MKKQSFSHQKIVNRKPYSSPSVKFYGNIYQKTHSNLPFTLTDGFLDQKTG